MELELFISDNLALLRSGGAMTGTSSDVSRKYFKRIIITDPNKNIVVISKFLRDKLTKQEFKAIYYHEVGHFVKGHNVKCLLGTEIKELQADAYSAGIVGPSVLLSALKKIPSIIRGCKELRAHGTITRSDDDYTYSLNNLLSNVENKMQYRYESLRKQCLIVDSIQK